MPECLLLICGKRLSWTIAILMLSRAISALAQTPQSQDSKLPVATKSAAGFYHPGILVNRAQLDFIKGKVAAKEEPWKSAFEAAKASEQGSSSYVPHPWKA